MSDETDSNSLNRRAFTAGIFYIVSQLFVRGISFLMTPVFTRLLTQQQYNQYKIFESWLLILTPLASLCLWRSVERAKYDVHEKFDEFTSSVLFLSFLPITVLFLLCLIFRTQVQAFCAMTDLNLTDFMLITAFLYTYAETAIMTFQRREKQKMHYRASTIFTALTVVPATLISVILVVWGRSSGRGDALVTLRIGGYYIPMILGGITIAVLMFAQGRKLVNGYYWKYALRFSLPLIPEVLSIQIMNQADKLMVTAMTGSVNGSVLSLATTVSYIIWILEDSVWNAWLPWMYEKMERGEGQDIRHYWRILMHAFGAVSLALVLFAPEIITILGSRTYYAAIWLIAPMMTGTLFRFYSNSYTAIQNYYHKTQYVAISTVTAMVLNVILNYTFIKLFGYQAAAYTSAFSYLVLMIMQALMEKHLTGEQLIPLSSTLRISCGWFAACMAAMLLFNLPFWLRWLIALVILIPVAVKFWPDVKSAVQLLRRPKES